MIADDSEVGEWPVQRDEMPNELNLLRRGYEEGCTQSSKYALICVDTFDTHRPGSVIYVHYVGSLKEAMAYEVKCRNVRPFGTLRVL